MKRFLSIFLLMIMLLSLASCVNDDNYGKEFPDLYTEAILSVPWTWGYVQAPLRKEPPEITILDTDSYGRSMYFYYEIPHGLVPGIQSGAILISQFSDEKSVYYYPNVNCISRYRNITRPSDFSDEQIEGLKKANDWDTPLQLDRCIQREFVKNKEGCPVSDEYEDTAIAIIKENNKSDVVTDWIANCDLFQNGIQDLYGRILYCGGGSFSTNDTEIYTSFAIAFIVCNHDIDPNIGVYYGIDPDGFFYSYEENNAFHQFLKANHWNEPIS